MIFDKKRTVNFDIEKDSSILGYVNRKVYYNTKTVIGQSEDVVYPVTSVETKLY